MYQKGFLPEIRSRHLSPCKWRLFCDAQSLQNCSQILDSHKKGRIDHTGVLQTPIKNYQRNLMYVLKYWSHALILTIEQLPPRKTSQLLAPLRVFLAFAKGIICLPSKALVINSLCEAVHFRRRKSTFLLSIELAMCITQTLQFFRQQSFFFLHRAVTT